VIGTIFYIAVAYDAYSDAIYNHKIWQQMSNPPKNFNHFGAALLGLFSYIFLYTGFITIFRIIIWVYDGIIGKD
jgi:hypothetical protein